MQVLYDVYCGKTKERVAPEMRADSSTVVPAKAGTPVSGAANNK
jgi:hypothetical protein